MVDYLVKRRSTWYYRRRLPSDIKSSFQGLREIKVSLRTSDSQVASRFSNNTQRDRDVYQRSERKNG